MLLSNSSRLKLLLVVSVAVVAGIGGCKGGKDTGSHAGPLEEPTAIVHLPLDVRAAVLSQHDDLAMDAAIFHEGSASLHIFAQDKRRDWLWEGDVADFRGNQIAVTGWAKTEVMMRPITVQLLVTPEKGDPRVMIHELQEVSRTTPWTQFRAEFPIADDIVPVRLKLGVLIPNPGQLWLDDLTVWDETRVTQ